MSNGEIILILGGARAGKSRFALRLAKGITLSREREAAVAGSVCFIATAEPLDTEMRARIERHREERPPDWLTIEEPKRLEAALARARDAQVVIVDCLTLFVSNWLLDIEDESVCERELERTVENFLATAAKSEQTIICVSNEVGLGLVPETSLGRSFRDALGRVNQRFAEASSQVYLLVAGLPIQLKPSDVSYQPSAVSHQ